MNIAKALGAAFLDLFRFRILLLVLVPPLASIVLWGSIAVLFWSQLMVLAQIFSDKFLYVQQIPQWVTEWFSITPALVATALAGLVAVLMVVPMAVLTSVVITQLLVMPVVVAVVETEFPTLEKKGTGWFHTSLKNTFWSSVVYLFLWMASLPLWMVPGLGFAIPILLNGYLNYRLFTFDVLIEYASRDEVKVLMKQRRIDFLLMGVVVATLMIFPLLFLVVPVYAALCFARLGMAELQTFRTSSASSLPTGSP